MKAKSYTIEHDTTVDLRTSSGSWSGSVPAGKHTASDELPEWVLEHVAAEQERQHREQEALAQSSVTPTEPVQEA